MLRVQGNSNFVVGVELDFLFLPHHFLGHYQVIGAFVRVRPGDLQPDGVVDRGGEGDEEEQVLSSQPAALIGPAVHRPIRREDEGEEEEEVG